MNTLAIPKLYVGTSGFSYKEWKGPFYPEKLPADQMLGYYATQFASVELNNTYYRLPKAQVIRKWASTVPRGFRFSLKASRRITHHARLRDTEETLSYLLHNSGLLGAACGPVLFQLPPQLACDVPLLRDFVALLPADRMFAMEFRHRSWLCDDVHTLLRERNIALCVTDAPEGVAPQGPQTQGTFSTGTWGYLRLRHEDYSPEDLGKWARRVAAQGWAEAYVYFKHEEAGAGPRLAKRFAGVLEGL